MYYPGLEGKNALLIGGNSNIGQYVSLLLAESGANIVIACRDTKRGNEIAEEARAFGKGEAVVVKTDCSDWEAIENAVSRVHEFGAIDILYHGVGGDWPGHFLDLDPELWDKLYQLNFKNILMAYKIVLPIMKQQRSGCFITMSSVMGRIPTPMEPIYGALKCGLIYLAQTLALDLGPYGVRINVVAPGPTPPKDPDRLSEGSLLKTLIENKELVENLTAEILPQIPLGKLGDPEACAHAVLYLASPVTGGYQTGQVIGVDGGWWMPK
ncbi:MAG: SDR family oxidoreductase [Gammaproteobacteria bacterium]|nr:SDR family oxidoreductase [Gammaproteobacteria bacterium]